MTKKQFTFEYTCYYPENTNLDILNKMHGTYELGFKVDYVNDSIYVTIESEGVDIEISINGYGCDIDLFDVTCLKDAYDVIKPEFSETFELLNDLRQFLKFEFTELWNEFYYENDLDNDVYESYPFEYQEFVDIFDNKIRETILSIY